MKKFRKVLAAPNREPKFYTRKRTAEIETLLGNSMPKETYEALENWIGVVPYKFVGTITFRYGGLCNDSLQGVSERFKTKVRKKFPDARFLFVFEEHRLMHTYHKRFHIHFMIEPLDLSLITLESKLKPVYRNIRTDGFRAVGIGRTDLQQVYDKADLLDYLTKPLRHGDCRMLNIDYVNSDLRNLSAA